MNQLKVALIGIGGFARKHVELFAELAGEGQMSCVAYAEPNVAANREQAEALNALGATHYTDYRELLAHPGLNAVVISTPIPLHKPMFIEAMKRGVHALTEKPPCVTIQDLDEMIEAARASGCVGAVNFQHTSDEAFLHFVKRLQEGAIGELRSVTGVGLWHRTNAYFTRTPWAGKIATPSGYVLDGPMCNALSHLLNNCLLAAGQGDAQAAEPVWVESELYRANPIESEDTSCVRLETKNGVRVGFYSSLCAERNETPYLTAKGTLGEMTWSYAHQYTHRDAAGQSTTFAFESKPDLRRMYDNWLGVIAGREERLYCSIADCRSFVLAANGAFAASGRVRPLPSEAVETRQEGDTDFVYVRDIERTLTRAAEEGKLYSELGLPWGGAPNRLSLTDYRAFHWQDGVRP